MRREMTGSAGRGGGGRRPERWGEAREGETREANLTERSQETRAKLEETNLREPGAIKEKRGDRGGQNCGSKTTRAISIIIQRDVRQRNKYHECVCMARNNELINIAFSHPKSEMNTSPFPLNCNV